MSILEEPERGGRLANELDWTRISITWGVGFVTEIAISNYLKLVVWIAIRSLQLNYSQWVLISGKWVIISGRAYLAEVCRIPLMSLKSADVISDVISTCHAIIVQ